MGKRQMWKNIWRFYAAVLFIFRFKKKGFSLWQVSCKMELSFSMNRLKRREEEMDVLCDAGLQCDLFCDTDVIFLECGG